MRSVADLQIRRIEPEWPQAFLPIFNCGLISMSRNSFDAFNAKATRSASSGAFDGTIMVASECGQSTPSCAAIMHIDDIVGPEPAAHRRRACAHGLCGGRCRLGTASSSMRGRR